MKKLFIPAMFIIALSGWSLSFYNMTKSAPKEYTELVMVDVLPDHSNCQYPDRLSNPPNGCDNSDPARPECMKFGTEDCDIPYPEQLDMVEPNPIVDKPVQKVLVCEYK